MLPGPAASLSRPVVVRAAAIVLAMAMVYYLSSHLGTFWLTGGRVSSPIFPGTGAALAALVLAGRGYWPAVLIGRLLAFVISGSSQPFGVWLAVAAGNALAAWAGT